MAQKVQVLLICDLHDDEVAAAETVVFRYDGYSYALSCASTLQSSTR